MHSWGGITQTLSLLLVVGGGDQKIVLVTGDQLQVQSSAATSIDAVMSIMEIT